MLFQLYLKTHVADFLTSRQFWYLCHPRWTPSTSNLYNVLHCNEHVEGKQQSRLKNDSLEDITSELSLKAQFKVSERTKWERKRRMRETHSLGRGSDPCKGICIWEMMIYLGPNKLRIAKKVSFHDIYPSYRVYAVLCACFTSAFRL